MCSRDDDDDDDGDDDVMAGIKTTPSSDEHMGSITETQRRHVETVRLCSSRVSAGNPSDDSHSEHYQTVPGPEPPEHHTLFLRIISFLNSSQL